MEIWIEMKRCGNASDKSVEDAVIKDQKLHCRCYCCNFKSEVGDTSNKDAAYCLCDLMEEFEAVFVLTDKGFWDRHG